MMSELREYAIAWAIVVAIGITSYAFHQTQPASVVTLSPLTVTLKTGEWVQASATAYDELGNVIPDATIQWLPTADSGPHCVSVEKGLITATTVGTCGVGALSVTSAGKVLLHETPITVVVSAPTPEPTPTPTPAPSPISKPCRLPNGKCRKDCVCL